MSNVSFSMTPLSFSGDTFSVSPDIVVTILLLLLWRLQSFHPLMYFLVNFLCSFNCFLSNSVICPPFPHLPSLNPLFIYNLIYILIIIIKSYLYLCIFPFVILSPFSFNIFRNKSWLGFLRFLWGGVFSFYFNNFWNISYCIHSGDFSFHWGFIREGNLRFFIFGVDLLLFHCNLFGKRGRGIFGNFKVGYLGEEKIGLMREQEGIFLLVQEDYVLLGRRWIFCSSWSRWLRHTQFCVLCLVFFVSVCYVVLQVSNTLCLFVYKLSLSASI